MLVPKRFTSTYPLYITILFIGFLSFITNFSTHDAQAAMIEHQAGASVRNYPLGFSIHAQSAYSDLLWGEKNKENFFYGFYKISLRANTSFKTAGANLKLELYPISFLGLQVGLQPSYRAFDFSGINCSTLQCQGTMHRSFIDIKGILGTKKYYLGYAIGYTFSSTKLEIGKTGFYDEGVSLSGNDSSDRVRGFEIWPGVAWTETQRTGVLFHSAKFHKSETSSQSVYGYYSYTQESHRFMMGAGVYQSTLQSQKPSVFVSYTYTSGESPNLF
jgi:hypothetical protein